MATTSLRSCHLDSLITLLPSQCIMNSILESFLGKSIIVFMDDIFVYSNSLEQHAIHLREVLSLLKAHKFYVKLAKCVFA
jgi:hypothetical protein